MRDEVIHRMSGCLDADDADDDADDAQLKSSVVLLLFVVCRWLVFVCVCGGMCVCMYVSRLFLLLLLLVTNFYRLK